MAYKQFPETQGSMLNINSEWKCEAGPSHFNSLLMQLQRFWYAKDITAHLELGEERRMSFFPLVYIKY